MAAGTAMAACQLQQRRAAMDHHGVLGPQKAKTARKQICKDADKRLQRNAALDGMREQFKPFGLKQSVRKEKFDVFSNKPVMGSDQVRPGDTKGIGELRRRAGLL